MYLGHGHVIFRPPDFRSFNHVVQTNVLQLLPIFAPKRKSQTTHESGALQVQTPFNNRLQMAGELGIHMKPRPPSLVALPPANGKKGERVRLVSLRL